MKSTNSILTEQGKFADSFPESELIINADRSIYHLNLTADQLAENIITVGDPDRVEKVSRYFDKIEHRIHKREFITHTGTYKGKRLSVISTGMGTDNIEILMNELDAIVNIDFKERRRKEKTTRLNIVRIGTSGSLQTDVELGSHLVSVNAIGLDTLMCFYRLEQSSREGAITEQLQQDLGLPFQPYCVAGSQSLLEKIGYDMVPGNTLTCPGFYAPQGRQLRFELKYPDLIKTFNRFRAGDFRLTNFEMETAGYYSLGRILGHEVLSVNAIVAHRINNQFDLNADHTVESLIQKVLDRL